MDGKELTNEEALQNFLLDIGCLDELLPWTGKFNMFDVLKISRTEIRHSNMLGWLLNPNENHGMGDVFLKGILQRLVENDSDGRYDVFNVLLMDFYTFSVMREWKNIDILLTSTEEKTVIAIENKVGSHEHSNQLNRYRNILEKEYPDYNRMLVFLTPDGEEPSDVENWDVLTYSDVIDVLESAALQIKVLPDVDLMIKNYIDVVRRDIVEDQQLIDICNKIYNACIHEQTEMRFVLFDSHLIFLISLQGFFLIRELLLVYIQILQLHYLYRDLYLPKIYSPILLNRTF